MWLSAHGVLMCGGQCIPAKVGVAGSGLLRVSGNSILGRPSVVHLSHRFHISGTGTASTGRDLR